MLCSSRPSVASATLTIVVSRIDMTEPTSTTALILQTCASMRSESAAMRSHRADRCARPENTTVPKGQVPKQPRVRSPRGRSFAGHVGRHRPRPSAGRRASGSRPQPARSPGRGPLSPVIELGSTGRRYGRCRCQAAGRSGGCWAAGHREPAIGRALPRARRAAPDAKPSASSVTGHGAAHTTHVVRSASSTELIVPVPETLTLTARASHEVGAGYSVGGRFCVKGACGCAAGMLAIT